MLIVYVMIVHAALNKASMNFTGSKLLPDKRRGRLEHFELVCLRCDLVWDLRFPYTFWSRTGPAAPEKQQQREPMIARPWPTSTIVDISTDLFVFEITLKFQSFYSLSDVEIIFHARLWSEPVLWVLNTHLSSANRKRRANWANHKASFRPASVLSASVYLLLWGLPSDRFRLFMPTSVGAANEQQGALYWRSINSAQAQCKSTKKLHLRSPLPFPYGSFVSMRSCLPDFKPCRHSVWLGCTSTFKPNSYWGLWVIYRSSLGSAVVSTKAMHTVHIGLFTDTD